VTQPAASPRTRTRIAAYQIADYLEQLGVEVVFGLCGHTVIAMLDALGKSRVRFVTTRHEQTAAHAADGYARATGKPVDGRCKLCRSPILWGSVGAAAAIASSATLGRPSTLPASSCTEGTATTSAAARSRAT